MPQFFLVQFLYDNVFPEQFQKVFFFVSMWIVKLFYVYLNSFCELSLIIKTKSFANSEVKTKYFIPQKVTPTALRALAFVIVYPWATGDQSEHALYFFWLYFVFVSASFFFSAIYQYLGKYKGRLFACYLVTCTLRRCIQVSL